MQHQKWVIAILGILVILRLRRVLFPRKENFKGGAPTPSPPPPPPVPEEPPKRINDVHQLARSWGLSGDELASRNITRLKHYVSVVSDENGFCYKLPRILKNVESVEILSATIPKSTYRVKRDNDTFPLRVETGGTTFYTEITLTEGEYDNILDIIIELNDKLYDVITTPSLYFLDESGAGNSLTFPTNFKFVAGYDSLLRKVIFCHTADPDLLFSLPFGDVVNSCHLVLGAGRDEAVELDGNIDGRGVEINDTSVRYPYERIMTENYINNRATSYYQAKVAGYPTSGTSGMTTTSMPKRVNMMKHLHINVDVKEVVYWDGTSRLIQVHIPFDEDIKFVQRPYRIDRRLRGRIENLDRLTFNFKAVQVDEEYAYDFNGVPWSLELELTTLEFDDNPLVDFDPLSE